LRFTGVNIPPGSTITAAHLEFYSTQSQWINLSLHIAGEAIDSSPTFTASNTPSQRASTSAVVNHASNVSWGVNTWNSLNEMRAVIQEIIARPGWRAGNSLSIILRGTSTNAWARKFAQSYDGNPAFATRLVITFSVPG
jgi:hypothetical protein